MWGYVYNIPMPYLLLRLSGILFLLLPLEAKGIRETLRFTSVS
jgi:hypothetical protein